MLSRFIAPKEDTLTASVFGHLLHLPIDVFWELLCDSCDGHQLPTSCGEPLGITPWPKWSAEGTGNASYVEPDLFFRFEKFDLIVEAKRWDSGMQNHDQWRSQLIAYHNHHHEDQKPLHYLALGGLWSHFRENFEYEIELDGELIEKTCSVHKGRWLKILTQCQRLLRHLRGSPLPSSQDLANQRLLLDLIELFAVHGFSTGRWFEDFEFLRNRPAHRQDTSALFTKLRSTYS